MKIVQEEIFGPVGVLIKFEDEEDVIRQANDTLYGLVREITRVGVTLLYDLWIVGRDGYGWGEPLRCNAPSLV